MIHEFSLRVLDFKIGRLHSYVLCIWSVTTTESLKCNRSRAYEPIASVCIPSSEAMWGDVHV